MTNDFNDAIFVVVVISSFPSPKKIIIRFGSYSYGESTEVQDSNLIRGALKLYLQY